MAQEEAHLKITGQITDIDSNQPLGGCHVFVDDKFGTVSLENGMFTLSLPVSFMGDNLYVSHVGYETNSRPLNDLVDKFAGFNMRTSVTILDEVVIVADPWSDFRDVVSDLSILYPNKKDLLNAIVEELKSIDPDLVLTEKME
jgi:hypothetical protein